MAKINSNSPTRGPVAGIINVHSKTYKEHSRTARGTKTPITLNESFKESCNEIISGNKPAKLIKDSIDLYRQDFKGGQLWQRLVGTFKRQVKEGKPFNVVDLNGLEINENYPLSQFFLGALSVYVQCRSGSLDILVKIPCFPKFKGKYVDGFRIRLIAIFPDFEADLADVHESVSYIISKDFAREDLKFDFHVGESAEQFIVCMKVEGTYDGKVLSGQTTKGMRIVSAGYLRRD